MEEGRQIQKGKRSTDWKRAASAFQQWIRIGRNYKIDCREGSKGKVSDTSWSKPTRLFETVELSFKRTFWSFVWWSLVDPICVRATLLVPQCPTLVNDLFFSLVRLQFPTAKPPGCSESFARPHNEEPKTPKKQVSEQEIKRRAMDGFDRPGFCFYVRLGKPTKHHPWVWDFCQLSFVSVTGWRWILQNGNPV